ncbi:16S rRNA (guanine(966)-N(2))-methyltransferase RsmD [Sediminicoccus sp. KRV36]|uniref:16S rRNA (guanine(966)-N(2))-methyltransferase RsmD n=1 Tax=Sediminicoccus sp. KRV36 TaxID=3133721 RepID=UPI00200C98F3|nr:16S rRNA (guanine(966)-N(2))-methyltransferase RsmD [Sediminicoccus rosea]UPY39340.1 16S rRNA (guanine(966)-N(2))-methyltransferase RsmD [Sediminicoccus rosea]
MRVISGAWKGKKLIAPEGEAVRPTSDRARQALFDMLWHAPWGGREVVDGAAVLDAFAGTGALGLEALSRGAVRATFIEKDRAALAALRANIANCRAQAQVIAGDATKPPRPIAPATLIFLDPPYGAGLLAPALAALDQAGWIAPGALLCTELGLRDERPETRFTPLDDRTHGKARLLILQA